MNMEPDFVTLKARELKPYHYAIWSSVAGGEPFANTICSIRWSEDGEYLWLGLESFNFHKVKPDEDIEVVPEPVAVSRYGRERYATWTLPPFREGA